ncbi:beta-ketoacyl synthase N-terminal-like domain-containing protein [Bacteroides sp. 224]|uniref:beta-ketoacyl synthase N-terminal-like domain-containing protein n=1 Tax=Bacteroides sp. 224 TaxID=2302936 RepID=UPI0013D706A8|nr:beta-ketoacyl synthase N-terminal-like domain-containing protein [Bacteroides sp. 224]NDV64323.1 beta-ACP synthase [Bacteroides sp. 224]
MGNRVNVYLTADNIISSLGFTTQENMEAISNYQSGILLQTDKTIADTPILAGLIDSQKLDAKAKQYKLENYTRIEQLFILSIQDVLAQSSIDITQPDCCLIFSTTKGNIELLSRHTDHLSEEVFLWKMAQRVSEYFHVSSTRIRIISNACISGVSALIVGKRLIEAGQYAKVIVTGADALSHFITSGFISFKSVSEQICRPFDAERDGLNLGEGCGTILLTTEPSPGKVVLAGGGISNDANHISGPSRTGDGLCYAIRQAMNDAGMEASDIDFANTHGTATVYNDEMESKAIHLAGLEDIPVNSLKSYLGHTLGAAGVIESIICAHQLTDNILFGTLGFKELGVPMSIKVQAVHQSCVAHTCVKTASGFGGCNAAVVLTTSPQMVNTALIDTEFACTVSPTLFIQNSHIRLEEETLFISKEQSFAAFIREAFKQTGESNMKFYKMDDLCKLGYIAAHYLLKDKEYTPTEIGIILENSGASLHSDLKHQILIDKDGDQGAGPAIFVYTLPNVVSGEICIRHKIQGENTFFIRKECDMEDLERYARIAMQKQQLKICIIGWCELVNEDYKGIFKVICR